MEEQYYSFGEICKGSNSKLFHQICGERLSVSLLRIRKKQLNGIWRNTLIWEWMMC